ncbi:type II toxin-antitoxin system VapC family toxin [Jiangella asiatica]|uniref:Ribonuclease VapC n=1 Tax=Jiangella asiatica TaxID=2530372 RepID=A0A4R5D9V9_9ACTN|nr:type II toxin-antitoxin system VapC family toxin [Jiangella asiatica]TDE10402.1 type II toxin-antitoxin system VapC family toxin [Jiangella asiatica]
MIVPDVNLLLYATITGFPQHVRARRWWEEAVNSAASIGLTPPAVFGFLRLATNARIFEYPMPVEDATGRVNEWFEQPNIALLTPGRAHMDIALDLLRGLGTAGNLTTDVQLAAYAIEHRAQLHSNDTDFGRFKGLSWVDPLATES